MKRPGLTVLAMATLAVGCGDGHARLSADDSYHVARVELAFSRTVLDGSDYSQTLDGVDYLIRLCRRNPNAKYDKRTVKQVLEDGANTLRPYQRDLAADLDRVLNDGCK